MTQFENTSQSFNLHEIWNLLFKKRWYIIMPTIITVLAALLATYFITPTYEASCSILMTDTSVLPPTVESGLEGGRGYRRQSSSDLRNTLSNQIKSTRFMKSLITKLNISTPEYIEKLISEKIKSMPDASAAELSENLLIQSISNNIRIAVEGSQIVKIFARSSSPGMASKMAQTLADIFLEESLAQELAGIQGSILFTEEQVAVYREKLYNAQNNLKQFRQDIIVSTVDEDTTTLSYNLNSIISAVEALDIDIANVEQSQSDIILRARNYQVEPSVLNLPGNILKLKSALMNTIPKLAELLGRYNWRDAKIVELNKDAKKISDQIDNEIKQYVSRAFPDLHSEAQADISLYYINQINIEFLRTKNAAMGKSIGKIKSHLTRDPAIEVTQERLQSEVDRYRGLYNTFVQHSQYAAIDQSAKKVEAQSKYMIVQPAVMPFAPISPNRMKMITLGLLIGVILGGSVIGFQLLMDDSFRNVDEVEEYLKIHVLATVPYIVTPYTKKKNNKGLIFVGTAISVILITAILFMRLKNG